MSGADHSKSSPGMLFNAASMADLLGPRGGSREGGKRGAKGKMVGAKSNADMSKELISSILRQETGDDTIRRTTPGKKKKGSKGKKTQGSSSGRVSREPSFNNSMSMNSLASARQQQQQAAAASGETAVVNPLDMARMSHNANNNVHVYAQGMAESSSSRDGKNQHKFDTSTSGEFGDDVTYLERQYQKVQNILKAIEKKLVGGYEQLVGEASEPNASPLRFNSEDAKLLLLFAGIREIDENACEELCEKCEVAVSSNNEERFAKEAEEFLKKEEHAAGGSSSPANPASSAYSSLPEVDFYRWNLSVMATLRHRLMAGVLASRRGQLASNFIEQAEVSANMVSILGPHPSTNRKQKAAAAAEAAAQQAAIINATGRPGTTGYDSDPDVIEVRDLAEDLFGDSVADTVNVGGGASIARSSSAGGGKRRGSRGSLSRVPTDGLEAGSSFMQSSFVGGNSTVDGLPPLQLPRSRTQRAGKAKRNLQKRSGFDDSFSRNTPRVLQEMSRTDPTAMRKGGRGGGSSQSLVGGESVAGSVNSKSSRQLAAGASMEDIMALKAELQNTQQGLRQLDSLVDHGIAWVHSNVDMKEIAAGGGLSDRTKDRCRKLALEKLFGAVGSAFESAQAWALHRWALIVRYEKVSQVALVYSRAKALERLTRVFHEAILRQYLKAFKPWKQSMAIKKRWEQEAAAAELQRVVRGFLGKRRTHRERRSKAATLIQCMGRRVKAKKRVTTRRKYLRLHRAAVAIQHFFQGLVLMRQARDECDRRRELRVARKILRDQKAYQDRIQREAREKMQADAASRKKQATKSAAAKIADRVDKKETNKKSRGRAAPKASPDKGAKGGSPKNMGGPPHRPAPINPVPYSPSSPGSNAGGASGYGGSPSQQQSPGAYGAYGAYAGGAQAQISPGGGPLTNMDEARRVKDEAERFLRENDPEYAQQMQEQEQELHRLRLQMETNGGSPQAGEQQQQHQEQQDASGGSRPASSEGGEKRGWFGGKSASPSNASPTNAGASGGGDKKSPSSWFGRTTPKADEAAEGGGGLHTNSIDGEVPSGDGGSSPAEKQGMFGMFGGKKSNPSSPTNIDGATPSPIPAAAAAAARPVQQEDEEEEEDDYLTPEQVAEQDRLKAIEEEKRILREKEEAYEESIRQKELQLQKEADEKGAAIEERDRIIFEREEKARLIREEEEAREKAIQDALDEEKRLAEEEEERLAEEEEERERREQELEDLRQQVIAEERAKMQSELDKIRADAAAEMEAMEAEREELKQLKLDAIGGGRGRSAGARSPVKSAALEPGSPSKGGMFGGMFGSRPSSAAPAAVGFGAEKNPEPGSPEAKAKAEADKKAASRPGSAAAAAAATPGSEAPKSPSRPGSASAFASGMLGSLTNMIKGGGKKGGVFGGTQSKGKFKPFDPDTYEYIDREEALRRIQCQIRNKISKRRIQKRREKQIAEHKRLGELLIWAIVMIQRNVRARQGRYKGLRKRKEKAEAHERLRERSANKIQKIVRGKIARKRVKLLWMKRGEEMKAAEWKAYQTKTDRKAKLKVLAAGTPRPDVDEDNDIVTWGMDPEQVNMLDDKIAKLEAIEKSIEAREKAMHDAQKLSEERAKILEDQLQKLEMRQKAEEAERAIQADLMANAMGSVPNTGRSTARGPGGGPQHLPSARRSARGSAPPSARGGPPTDRASARGGGHASVPASARHSAPPTARSARESAIPSDAPRMMHENVEWVQLWDPDEKATYWYCETTQAAQWETPGETPYDYNQHYDSGYDTDHTGAMTDYSTDYASGAESEYSEWRDDGEWQEYWDESAQAKYWYNEATGEASWTPPEGQGDGGGGGASASVPASAREMPDEWVSYVDETTGQEYWYNSRTGETSWA